MTDRACSRGECFRGDVPQHHIRSLRSDVTGITASYLGFGFAATVKAALVIRAEPVTWIS